jgi:hypothetical protein
MVKLMKGPVAWIYVKYGKHLEWPHSTEERGGGGLGCLYICHCVCYAVVLTKGVESLSSYSYK